VPTSAVPTSTPIQGIFEDRDKTPPEFARSYQFENGWTDGNTNGTVIVWAGSTRSDSQQGVIIVVNVTKNYAVDAALRTPTRSGAIRIIAEQNRQLTLQATNGDRFVFDITSRQFVTAPPAATPIVTPAPTP
jgi:hypothetical protein